MNREDILEIADKAQVLGSTCTVASVERIVALFAEHDTALLRQALEALEDCSDQMLRKGVFVDDHHPDRIALNAAYAVLDALRERLGEKG